MTGKVIIFDLQGGDHGYAETRPALIRARAEGLNVEGANGLDEAMGLLATGKGHILVSAGNTKEVSTAVTKVLRPLRVARPEKAGREQFIRPPALLELPVIGQNGSFVLTDAGAHTSFSAFDLYLNAAYGITFARSVLKIDRPIVGFKGIGEEEAKMRAEDREALQFLLQHPELGYQIHGEGPIESKEMIRGEAHVIATDGWTGNNDLKTYEACFQATMGLVKQSLKDRPLRGMIVKKVGQPCFDSIRQRFDPKRYAGALIGGLQRIQGVAPLVVITHGRFKRDELYGALVRAHEFLQSDVGEHLLEIPLNVEQVKQPA